MYNIKKASQHESLRKDEMRVMEMGDLFESRSFPRNRRADAKLNSQEIARQVYLIFLSLILEKNRFWIEKIASKRWYISKL